MVLLDSRFCGERLNVFLAAKVYDIAYVFQYLRFTVVRLHRAVNKLQNLCGAFRQFLDITWPGIAHANKIIRSYVR